MSIYERLKAGESIESIKMAFGRELAEATDTLRKEKEEEHVMRNLTPARKKLLDSMIKYIETYLEGLYGRPCPFSKKEIKEIEQELIDQEKELKEYSSRLTPNDAGSELAGFLRDYIIANAKDIEDEDFLF